MQRLNGERTRLLLTLLAVLVLGSLVAVLRRRRSHRKQASIDERARRTSPNDGPSPEDDAELYVTLASLEEARMMEHTAVVMRGAGGGQVYATVPVKYVACDEATLTSLVRALDAVEGRRNGGTVKFELAPIDSGIAGGMGGAAIVDGIWLHPRLAAFGILPFVTDVLHGRQSIDDVRPLLLARTPEARAQQGDARSA
jgi:hypothetical protein